MQLDATPPWRLSARELVDGYGQGTLSPVQVCQSVLQRLDAMNPLLNAVIARDDAAVLAAARASEARWQMGQPLSPLDGVPLTVKDNIPVAGLPCRWGSRLYASHMPAKDETPVARLRSAGLVFIGKTNVPEFTLQGYTDNLLAGATGNPWAPSLTPGGSSGGAVTAVAAGIGPLALGTDGGGSIRRPCAYTGLVGLKPGRGVVPRGDGLPELLPGLEEIGPIARHTADLVQLLRILAPSLRDAFAKPLLRKPLNIAYWRSIGESPVDDIILSRIDDASVQLQALGHRVTVQPSLPIVESFNRNAWPIISSTGLAAVLHGRSPDELRQLTPALAILLEQGRRHTGVDLFHAQALQRELTRHLTGFFTGYDLLLTPACAAMPWPATQSHPTHIAGQPVHARGHAVFTAFVNGAGLPALALPAHRAPDGLPIGFQLVGPTGSEPLLCALGLAWEAANPHLSNNLTP